jgi:hypothetical protein
MGGVAMSLRYELLIIVSLIAATLGTAHALERGTIGLASLAHTVLSRG